MKLDLTDPLDARWYCENFEIPGKGKINWVKIDGVKIFFNRMNDEEAIRCAHGLYEMQCQAESNLSKRLGEIQ